MPRFNYGAYTPQSIYFAGQGSSTPSGSSLYISPQLTALSATTYFTYIDAPTVSGSGTSASSLFIAGEPTGGTITNSYALQIASGKLYVGGSLQIPTGASSNFVLSSDATGNASWVSPTTLAFTGFSDGTVSEPGAYWLSQMSTGFYKPGPSQIYISLAGTNTAGFTSTGTFSSVSQALTGIGSTTAASSSLYINPASTALTGSSTYFFTYLAAPITTVSTFTGIAATLYIAGAPTTTTGGVGFALRIASGNTLTSGNITLNGTASVLSLSGPSAVVVLAGTSASTSSTTGAFRCQGGAYLGANSLFAGSITMDGTAATLALSGTSSTVTLAGTSASTSSTTGALQVAGGAYFGANSLFAGNITMNGTGAILALSGASSTVTLAGTAASTNSTTGALQVAGGAYFGANSLFAGNVTINGTSLFGGSVMFSSGVTATNSGNIDLSGSSGTFSTPTGVVTIGSGAVSVTGRTTFSSVGNSTIASSTLYVNPTSTTLGTNTYFTYLTAPTTSGTGTTASTLFIAGAPTGGTITNSFALNVSSGIVKISDSTASSSSATGALIVSGGVGIGGNISVGGKLQSSGPVIYQPNVLTASTILTTDTPLLNVINSSTVISIRLPGAPTNGLIFKFINVGSASYIFIVSDDLNSDYFNGTTNQSFQMYQYDKVALIYYNNNWFNI